VLTLELEKQSNVAAMIITLKLKLLKAAMLRFVLLICVSGGAYSALQLAHGRKLFMTTFYI